MDRRSFLVAAWGALAASSSGSAFARGARFDDPENGAWGAALSAQDTTGVLPPLSPRALAGTALAVGNAAPEGARSVILPNLPSIATQGVPGHVGAPGSCEAQSFGYCLGAYTAARNPDGSARWSAADARNQPSAAWLYQWEHRITEHDRRVCPKGSGAKPYLERLVSDGAPSTADVPYDPHAAATIAAECAYINGLDVARAWPDEARLTIGSYKVYTNVLHGKARYLEAFRELIRHGHAIAFTGSVARGYRQPQLAGGVFTAPQGFIPKSGHGQVIVGYDDGKGPHGAFLVQNSFGTEWNPGDASDPGRNGRIWWDYDAFFASQKYAAIAYPAGPPEVAGRRSATTLQTNDPGAPHFAVLDALPHSDEDAHHLVLVTHASDALTLTDVQVRGPHGRLFRAPLNTSTRLGYQYVRRGGAPFAPGRYQVRYTARTRSGRSVTYQGAVDVAAR